MKQKERLYFLLNYPIKESLRYSNIKIPTDIAEQKNLLRSLMNVRMPKPVSNEFLTIQSVYACINYGESACPREIENQSICINADIGKVLENLR